MMELNDKRDWLRNIHIPIDKYKAELDNGSFRDAIDFYQNKIIMSL